MLRECRQKIEGLQYFFMPHNIFSQNKNFTSRTPPISTLSLTGGADSHFFPIFPPFQINWAPQFTRLLDTKELHFWNIKCPHSLIPKTCNIDFSRFFNADHGSHAVYLFQLYKYVKTLYKYEKPCKSCRKYQHNPLYTTHSAWLLPIFFFKKMRCYNS